MNTSISILSQIQVRIVEKEDYYTQLLQGGRSLGNNLWAVLRFLRFARKALTERGTVVVINDNMHALARVFGEKKTGQVGGSGYFDTQLEGYLYLTI